MNRHRIILGWLFFGIALLISVVLVFASKNYFGNAGTQHADWVMRTALMVATVFAAAGLSLLVDHRFSKWICLPLAVFTLFSFPLGTFLGGYYLWYFWKYLYKRKDDAAT